MRMFAACIFASIVMAISQLLPGFEFDGRYERCLLYAVVWLCGYEIFEKLDK